jgi:ABC-type Fe3+-citrate transport system substrate-binding protein
MANEIQDKIKHCKTKLDLIELKEQRQKKALAEIKAITDEITMHNEAIAIYQKKLKLLDEYIEILNTAKNVIQQLQAVEQQIASLKEKLEKTEKYEKLIAAKYPQFKNFSQEKRNNIHAMQLYTGRYN